MADLIKSSNAPGVTKHCIIDTRGNVLYVTAGVADRYWEDIELGKGNIIVTRHDVTHLLQRDRDIPKDDESRARLERAIDPYRDEIAKRKVAAKAHDAEAQAANDKPARTQDVMQGLAALAGSLRGSDPADVQLLREQNAALMARLDALEAKNSKPAKSEAAKAEAAK
jgi:hypothetical protein